MDNGDHLRLYHCQTGFKLVSGNSGFVTCQPYFPDYPAKLMNAGKFSKTDMIIGVNRDEASLWLLHIPGNDWLSFIC